MTAEQIAIIVSIISVIGAITTAIYAFSQSSSSVKNDVINTYEKRVKQLEEDMTIQTMKMDDILRKMKDLQEILTKREAELKVVTDLLQGRDPQMQSFMATMLKSAPAAATAASIAVTAANEAARFASAAKDEAGKISSYTVQNSHMLELLLRHFDIPLVPPAPGI